MSISIITENIITKEERYESLITEIESLISGENNFIANVSNITSVLNGSFDEFSWVGFYFLGNENKGELILGPFQGKTACTRISKGKGVCGQAVNRKQTIIVEDVNEFPGHISCDSESKSEIVVPIIKNGSVKGVLDIDSYEYSAFNETDKAYLEDLIHNILYIF